MKQFVCTLCKLTRINESLEDDLVADGYDNIFNTTKNHPYLDGENHEHDIEGNYVNSCRVR